MILITSWAGTSKLISPKSMLDLDLLSLLRYMQEFINPYLIDGHAFDFGVYVLITSIDPIRIYRWKSEILLRFCAEPYQPFDANNVNKYVVGESHIPHWEMPSLKNVTETFGFSALKAFNHYLKNQEQEVDELWEQIDDAIVSITLSKVDQINRHVYYFYKGNSGQKQKFFELLRYDFIIDDKFDLHLLEVSKVLFDILILLMVLVGQFES